MHPPNRCLSDQLQKNFLKLFGCSKSTDRPLSGQKWASAWWVSPALDETVFTSHIQEWWLFSYRTFGILFFTLFTGITNRTILKLCEFQAKTAREVFWSIFTASVPALIFSSATSPEQIHDHSCMPTIIIKLYSTPSKYSELYES